RNRANSSSLAFRSAAIARSSWPSIQWYHIASASAATRSRTSAGVRIVSLLISHRPVWVSIGAPAARSASSTSPSDRATIAWPPAARSASIQAAWENRSGSRCIGGLLCLQHRPDPLPDQLGVIRVQLDQYGVAPVARGDHAGRAGAGEGIQHGAALRA